MNHGAYQDRTGGVLVIEPKPSRLLAVVLTATHLITLFVFSLLPLSSWIVLLLIGATLVSLMYVLRRHVLLQGKKAVTKLIWDGEGSWKILNGKQKFLDAELRHDSVVSRRLIILNLRTSRAENRSLVLLQDSLDQDTMRQLRVLARLQSTPEHSKRSPG